MGVFEHHFRLFYVDKLWTLKKSIRYLAAGVPLSSGPEECVKSPVKRTEMKN